MYYYLELYDKRPVKNEVALTVRDVRVKDFDEQIWLGDTGVLSHMINSPKGMKNLWANNS